GLKSLYYSPLVKVVKVFVHRRLTNRALRRHTGSGSDRVYVMVHATAGRYRSRYHTIAVDWTSQCDNSQHRKSRQSSPRESFLHIEHGQSLARLQRLDAHLSGHVLRDGAERLSLGAVGPADDDGDSKVAAFANVDRDRDRAEEGRSVSFGQCLA